MINEMRDKKRGQDMVGVNKKMHIKLKGENGLYLSCDINGSDFPPAITLSETPYSWLVRFTEKGAGQLDTHFEGSDEPYHIQPRSLSGKDYDAILTTENFCILNYNFVDHLVMDETSIELRTKGLYLSFKDNTKEVEFNGNETLWILLDCKD